ncbi:MAG: helix-turn-helix transcriptional regulator [Deltaproteobacteria bacterium]|nr:helix-turn-helix transcriptional regulator [Deltaproteobacteria bacterium]
MERNKDGNSQNLGRIIKQQRLLSGLTLRKLANSSGVSSSHIGRIERGERFPSAHVLRHIARHLGFGESELFALAGYFTPQPPTVAERQAADSFTQLDPIVARALSQEPIDIQRLALVILTLIKSIAKSKD